MQLDRGLPDNSSGIVVSHSSSICCISRASILSAQKGRPSCSVLATIEPGMRISGISLNDQCGRPGHSEPLAASSEGICLMAFVIAVRDPVDGPSAVAAIVGRSGLVA